jgi:hypothetical protein
MWHTNGSWFPPGFLDSAFPFDIWDLGRRLAIADLETEATYP